MSKLITSPQNPLIKNVLLLIEKPRERKVQNLVVIEGSRETRLAMGSGCVLKSAIFCNEYFIDKESFRQELEDDPSVEFVEVSPEIYNRLAYRKDHGGIIVLAEPRRMSFNELTLSDKPLILVLETVEKPGNLGAILRTADAANLDAVVICDPQTDVYNPNAIRASIGCIFTVPVVTATTEDTIAWLRNQKITAYGAALTGAQPYDQTDFSQSSAIIMGSEAFGLTETWLKAAESLIKIPMNGKIDSLNVSTSAAILVFEALRQRGIR